MSNLHLPSRIVEAIEKGDIEFLESLPLAAIPRDAMNAEGESLLHVAASFPHIEAAALLMFRGCDVSGRDADGETPLHAACLHSSAEMVEFLISQGADAHAKRKNGNSTLHSASINGTSEIIEMLLDRGVDPNHCNTAGITPLMFATRRPSALRALLRAGARVDSTSEMGDTALHFAAAVVNLESVKELIAYGADPKVTNLAGASPMDLIPRVCPDWRVVRQLLAPAEGSYRPE